VNFTAAKGVSLTGYKEVVATCEGSDFSDMGTCGGGSGGSGDASKADVTRTATPSTVQLRSPAQWDANCVCANTGRRPVMRIAVPEVVVGAACKAA
jgi:hypothetical protein